MSIFSSYKKIFLLGFIIVILIAIPFSVYVAQKSQQTQSHASASTTLALDPASPSVKAGDTLTLNVMLDPGSTGSVNQVSSVKLVFSFDPLKFTTVSDSLAPNPNAPNTLKEILEDAAYTSGTASILLSIGADPNKVLTTKAKIATLKLKALTATEDNNPSSITFDKTTQVLSIASSDQTNENVLSTTTPATVTITGASSTTTPGTTPTITATPSTTAAPAQKITPGPGTTSAPAIPPSGLTPTVSTPSPTIIPISIVSPTIPPIGNTKGGLPPTGPGEKIIGLGILGTILTVIGGILFISL